MIDFKLNEKDVAELIETTQNCIQLKGFSGTERERVNYLIRVASKLGYSKIYKDSMGSLIAEMKLGNGNGPKIVLTGHLDTVGAIRSDWSPQTPPFAGVILDGKLYGRGASDMLGAVSSMLHSIAKLKNLDNNKLNGTVYFVGTVVEEMFEGVAFLEALKKIQPDYIIVGESSWGRINIGQRGRAEVVITTHGESQHASTGRNVINAIEQIAYIIDVFHRWYKSDHDKVLGKRNIVPTDIKIPVGGGGGIDGRGGNSTVPNKVELTYDIRTLVGDTPESIMRLLRDNLKVVVENGRKKYPNFKEPDIIFSQEGIKTYTGVYIEQIKFAPAWKTDENSEIVKKAIQGLKNVGIKQPELGSYSFCTDGSAVVKYREMFPDKDLSIIGYGPGKEEYAHTINEYIEIEQLKEVYKGYVGIVSELLKS